MLISTGVLTLEEKPTSSVGIPWEKLRRPEVDGYHGLPPLDAKLCLELRHMPDEFLHARLERYIVARFI
jgi:hypothetical protein